MTLDYEPATAEDRSFFIHAHHTAYRAIIEMMFSWNEAEQDKFAAKAFDQGGIKVIWSDSQRVGVVGWDQCPDHIWLKELYILPSEQCRGVGSAVIRHIKSIAEEHKIEVRLQTLKANERAKALYERSGFTVSEETDIHWKMVCL